jgi:hypothetical protein
MVFVDIVGMDIVAMTKKRRRLGGLLFLARWRDEVLVFVGRHFIGLIG